MNTLALSPVMRRSVALIAAGLSLAAHLPADDRDAQRATLSAPRVAANVAVTVDPRVPAPAPGLPFDFFPLDRLAEYQGESRFPEASLPAVFVAAGDPDFDAEQPGLPEAAIIRDDAMLIDPPPTYSRRLWQSLSHGFHEWTSRISLGARSLMGNSDQNFIDFAADFERRQPHRATQINLLGQVGESNDDIVANRWFANSTTDFYHGPGWLSFVKIMDQYDQLQNLDYRGTFSGGAGYRFFNEDQKRLVVRLGPGVTTEFFHSPARNRTTPDLFGEVEVRMPLVDRLKWEQKTTVFPSLSALEVARATSQAALLYAFDEKERWSLKLGLLYQYISEPNPGRLPNDFTTNLSIVYLRR